MKKDVFKLTLPILAEQTFVMLLGVVNTIMAGHLGKEILSAIGMIDAINNIIIAFFSALAIGGTVIVARDFGAGKKEQAKVTALNAVFATLLLALIVTGLLWFGKKNILSLIYTEAEGKVIENALIYFRVTLLTYPLLALTFISFGLLRGSGNSKAPMKVSLVMNIINVVLGYIFIFGLDIKNTQFHLVIPSMGIYGAAYAIALARTGGAFMALYALIKHVLILDLEIIRKFRFDMRILKKVFGIGVPSGMESLIFNAGKLVLQVVVVGYGTYSIAASTICWSLFGLLNIPGTAIAIGATTLVSQSLGRQMKEEARSLIYYLVKLTMVAQGIVSVPFYIFTPVIVGFYTKEANVASIAIGIMRTCAVAMPLIWAHSFVIPQGLKGGGDVKFTLAASVVSMWAFRVAFGYLFGTVFGLGIAGLWFGMYVDWIFRSLVFYLRTRKDQWIHA